MSGEDDHYKVLGLACEASASDIKKAYRKLALKYHPDKQNGASQTERESASATFAKIAAAYEILSDEEERYQYDMRRKHGGAPGTRYTTTNDKAGPKGHHSSPSSRGSYTPTGSTGATPSSFHFSYDPSKVKSRDPEAIFREVFGKDFNAVYPDASMMGSPAKSPATPSTPRTKMKKKATASPIPATPTKSSTTHRRSPASYATPTRIKAKASLLKTKVPNLGHDEDDILSMSSSTKTVCHADGSHEVITETTIIRKDGSKQTSRESNRSTPSKIRRQVQKMPRQSTSYVKAL